MRVVGYSLLAVLLVSVAPWATEGELRVAAWNPEHLDDADSEGCVGRVGAEYGALGRRIEALAADVIAFQEVENTAAARRVFPQHRWRVELSRRPPMERSRACRGKPGSRLGHLGTGFAIRNGVDYRRNADLTELGRENAFQRWGVDIAAAAGAVNCACCQCT